MIRNFLVWLCVTALLLPAGPALAIESSSLPDIGSPADAVLSKEKEQQIGRAIYRSLRATEKVVTDPEIQEYVQDIGQKLAVNAQDGGFRFQFFVIEDPAINAFALPGGYIGVHSGLLLATRNESELAGVLAHEIAHVTQRHISRAVYKNQRASILTMAAMLGAILVGAASGNPDVVQGAIATTQSLAAQQRINYTRSNEYEADRVGVSILSRSGFDPRGMPSFFETLARQTGPLASQAPEFLRTHPVTVNRIAETRSRIEELPVNDVSNTYGYTLTRARLLVLTARTPEKALEQLLAEREDPELVGELGIEYGIALCYMQLGRYDEARAIFANLLESHDEVIPFHSALALAQLASGDRPAAAATFEKAIALFPRNLPLTIRYADALMRNQDPQRAHRLLLDLYNQVPPTSEQVRQIALAASAAGDTADAHYYMAEFHIMNGDLRMAADQLRLALSIPGLDGVQRARFQSRLEQIQRFLEPQVGQTGRGASAGRPG